VKKREKVRYFSVLGNRDGESRERGKSLNEDAVVHGWKEREDGGISHQ